MFPGFRKEPRFFVCMRYFRLRRTVRRDVAPYNGRFFFCVDTVFYGTASAQKTRKSVPYGVSMILYRRGGVGPPVIYPPAVRPEIIVSRETIYRHKKRDGISAKNAQVHPIQCFNDIITILYCRGGGCPPVMVPASR